MKPLPHPAENNFLHEWTKVVFHFTPLDTERAKRLVKAYTSLFFQSFDFPQFPKDHELSSFSKPPYFRFFHSLGYLWIDKSLRVRHFDSKFTSLRPIG